MYNIQYFTVMAFTSDTSKYTAGQVDSTVNDINILILICRYSWYYTELWILFLFQHNNSARVPTAAPLAVAVAVGLSSSSPPPTFTPFTFQKLVQGQYRRRRRRRRPAWPRRAPAQVATRETGSGSSSQLCVKLA